jgi:hypothetical protein
MDIENVVGDSLNLVCKFDSRSLFFCKFSKKLDEVNLAQK